MASYQEIYTRGQQTVGVWQHFAPTLTFGTLALAGHSADVAAMPPAEQAVVDAEAFIDERRDARNAAIITVREIGLRVPRLAANSLPPEDSLQDDIEKIQRTPMPSDEAVLDRGRATLTLWHSTNAHRAAATPALPPLTLPMGGGAPFAVADLAMVLTQIETLEQAVKDAAGPLSAVRSARRALGARVDRNNKRWYEAWGAHFPTGTPEHDALSQITTEGGGSPPVEPPTPPPPPPPPPQLPGMATIGSVTVNETDVGITGLAATDAVTFTLELRPPGGEFATEAQGVNGPDFSIIRPATPGTYELRAAGVNNIGLGPWSGAVPFDIP